VKPFVQSLIKFIHKGVFAPGGSNKKVRKLQTKPEMANMPKYMLRPFSERFRMNSFGMVQNFNSMEEEKKQEH